MSTITMPRFVPISLDEMNARAALQRRVDRKYVLTQPQTDSFLALLPAATRVLDIDGRMSFNYRSTYFDTPELTSFRASALGRRHRIKARSRCYVDSGDTFFEVKTRARGLTVKDRVPTLDADRLNRASARLVAARAPRPADFAAHRLRPVLDVAYRRTTLLIDHESRVTLDTQLDWRSRATGAARLADGLVIVETKSVGHAGAADHLLWRLGHRPARISKYATGLAALDPALPDNRWHRTLAGLNTLTDKD